MSKYTITPWRTQADLLQVRQQLYRLDPDDTVDRRRTAVERVMAWKLRGHLPHAVESTALLIDAILHHRHHHHHEGKQYDGAISSFSVRAVYSAAFSRFVTGFCDIGRNKERSLEPSSMLAIARQLDLPAEFVALRHEATHEELPALRRLVRATDEALRWLWQAYWSRLEVPAGKGHEQGTWEADIDGEAVPSKVRSEARQILRGFRSARREAIRAGRQQRADQESLMTQTSSAFMNLCGDGSDWISVVVEILVEEKLLFPSKRELGSSLEGAYLIWDDLLQHLWRAQSHFPEALVHSLLQMTSSRVLAQPEQDTEREALCLWLTHVIDGDTWISFLSEAERSHLRDDVMKWCCMYPSLWSQFLGSRLMEGGDVEFQADWKEIFQASCLQISDEDNPGTPPRPSDSAQTDSMECEVTPGGQGQTEQEQANGHGSCGWTRAVLPWTTPIGVVQ